MSMRTLIAALAALMIASPAFADKKADIARVEDYLSKLTTVVADFSQVDANGQLSEGKFYLKRPGKMRWQYKPPTPILLVSDGSVIVYYDSELDQVNYVPIDDTLAGFLAKPVIKLNSESTTLTEFKSKDSVIRATLVQKAKPTEGSLTLEFSDKPLQLKQMVTRDAMGQETTIQLQNAVFGTVLPNSLFKFEDPRGATKRRAGR